MPDKLNYKILGDDPLSTEEKIAKYTGDVDWHYLRPHFEKGDLLYVTPELDLQEVAQAFASDDKARVEAWLKAADILKPDKLHADWWEKSQPRFNTAIVYPFLLAQPLSEKPD